MDIREKPPKLSIILGQSYTGKSSYAQYLSKTYDCEIIHIYDLENGYPREDIPFVHDICITLHKFKSIPEKLEATLNEIYTKDKNILIVFDVGTRLEEYSIHDKIQNILEKWNISALFVMFNYHGLPSYYRAKGVYHMMKSCTVQSVVLNKTIYTVYPELAKKAHLLLKETDISYNDVLVIDYEKQQTYINSRGMVKKALST